MRGKGQILSNKTPPPIAVMPYNPEWAQMFEKECSRIKAALGTIAIRIDHVGSTSVPGMVAKPIIDIQISVNQVHPMLQYKGLLERLGYAHLPDVPPGDKIYPLFHAPSTWPHKYHAHLCEHRGPHEWRHLVYRDLLRESADLRSKYIALKQDLVRKFGLNSPGALDRYAAGKSEFIAQMEDHCRREGRAIEL